MIGLSGREKQHQGQKNCWNHHQTPNFLLFLVEKTQLEQDDQIGQQVKRAPHDYAS
jgi:hypothetical protein